MNLLLLIPGLIKNYFRNFRDLKKNISKMNYYSKKIITSTGPKPFFKRSFPFKEFLLNQNCQYQIANKKQ